MIEAFREFARGLEAPETWFIVALAATVGGFALAQAFRALKRARLVEDTPTSLIRSAAQGYCELFGHAELMPGAPIRAPLTATTCIWWEYKVEEKTRSGKNSRWRVIEQDVSGSLFALDDTTGRCVVDPDGAEVIGPAPQTWYGNTPRPMLGPAAGSRWGLGNDYRYTQRLIPPETQLLAIGFFETHADPHSSSDAQRELALKLAEWKRDSGHLKARFDADGDGQVDLQEWEAARRAAQREVGAQLAERALTPGVHLMREPRDGRPYLLSTHDQDTLAGKRRWIARFALLGAACCAGLAVALLLARGG